METTTLETQQKMGDYPLHSLWVSGILVTYNNQLYLVSTHSYNPTNHNTLPQLAKLSIQHNIHSEKIIISPHLAIITNQRNTYSFLRFTKCTVSKNHFFFSSRYLTCLINNRRTNCISNQSSSAPHIVSNQLIASSTNMLSGIFRFTITHNSHFINYSHPITTYINTSHYPKF